MSQQSASAAAGEQRKKASTAPPSARRKRTALAADAPSAKPDSAGKRRVQHSGTRNARHASLLERAVEPLSFLRPLLPQSAEAQQQQMRKLERELGVVDSADEESNSDTKNADSAKNNKK